MYVTHITYDILCMILYTCTHKMFNMYVLYIYTYAYIQAQREGEIERHSVYLYIYLLDPFPVMSFRACKRTWDRPTEPPTIKVCEHRWQA